MTKGQSMSDETRAVKHWNLLRLRWPILVIPYFIGIVWTSLHPVISVMTGKLHCRGFYIDENALDASAFRTDSKYDVTPKHLEHGSISLCATLKKIKSHVSCHSHSSEFDVAKIVPTANAVEPTTEAIVLVVPPPATGTWTSSDLHHVILQLIHRLSQSQSCPWLAKTILVVSARRGNILLNETVSQFLPAYLGPSTAMERTDDKDYLPLTFTSAIIRNLLVLDVQLVESGQPRNEIQILPQGRRGVLPNMDLVFVSVSVFLRARFLDNRLQRHATTSLLVHPYEQEAAKMRLLVETNVPRSLQHWAYSLGNMMLFSYSLVMGPFPPHAIVLDRGIDSLSLIARFSGQPGGIMVGHVVEYVQSIELILRALSNLHERLHHSITSYLLPSPTTFVSQAEYLVPTILLLIPLVLRAGMLAFIDLKTGFHLWTVGYGILMSLATATCLMVMPLENSAAATSYMALLYSCAYLLLREMTNLKRGETKIAMERKQMIQSLHFVTCIVATYLHVPIMFAHVSLAYPSALLWVPLLSFPSYAEPAVGYLRTTILFLVVVGTWPPVIVASQIFYGYTDFVRFAYTPLHMLLSSFLFLVS
jgi:glycosylphosphatidylinositol transamidase